MSRSPKRKMVDCLGLGIMPLDLLFEVDRYPVRGSKINGNGLTVQGGGPVPNVLVGLSRSGYSTELITAVGDDLIGRIGLDECRKEGVGLRNVITKRGSSLAAGGFIDKETGNRTLVLNLELFVKPRDLNLSTLPIPKLIHLDGRDLDASVKLARWGRKQGAEICFDIGSTRNDVSPILGQVDHLIVADEFAFPFTRTKSISRALAKLQDWCSGVVGVTCGLEGSYCVEGNQIMHQPAYRAKTVDTTGAGDAFHYGYILGLLKGLPLAERMRLGAAAAALKCGEMGARTAIPTYRQIVRFLKGRPRTYA